MRKIVKISARKFNLPKNCCCCGAGVATQSYEATAKRTRGKRIIKTFSRSFLFPICETCTRWIFFEVTARRMSFAAVLLGMFLVYLLANRHYHYMPLDILFLGLAALFWRTARKRANLIKQNQNCDVIPVHYVGWHGTVHSFEFANDSFVNSFKTANEEKLVA